MGLYKPPIKWPTIEIPWLSMVQKADPEFERRKHRVAEYVTSHGKVFWGDPYVRSAYATPTRITTKSYSGPLTFAAGDLTGVGFDVVTFVNTSTTPGTLTTRTAAQMFADITGAVPGIGHLLRIVANNVGGPDMTIAPGAHVIVLDRSGWQVSAILIKAGTYCDIKVQFPDAADAIFAVDAFGSPYSALVG